MGVAVVLLANVFFFGGGKCPNLGVVNVRILGVVNVRLANNLTPCEKLTLHSNLIWQATALFKTNSSQSQMRMKILFQG